jgi:hypothetical protein
MSVNATSRDAMAIGARTAPTRALRLEKPRQSSSSGDPDRGFKDRRGERLTRRAAYRFDTVRVSPWNAPLLDAPYAAQVIAQTLPTSAARSASAAYAGRVHIATALILDRSL